RIVDDASAEIKTLLHRLRLLGSPISTIDDARTRQSRCNRCARICELDAAFSLKPIALSAVGPRHVLPF
ncbi:hypothetical protein, partial [Xanthomonas hortorum]|uniref:hypothetical protein n=1 Tax=Xanthomonas hortorum TaxID=56454 RepID=UPI002FE376B9